jgi:transposase
LCLNCTINIPRGYYELLAIDGLGSRLAGWDVSDTRAMSVIPAEAGHFEEWSFAAPYLSLMTPDAPQRTYELREVFDALRWLVRTGAAWRYLPGDFPPWEAVYQQTQRWLKAEVFETMAHDLRELVRLTQEREKVPSATILDGRTLQSTPESGHRAGFDTRYAGHFGHKRKRGSKVHAAVDTLGLLLALVVTPANEQERAQVEQLAS